MLRSLAYIVLILIVLWAVRSLLREVAALLGRKPGPQPEELVRDVFCDTYIPKRSALRKRIAGKDHYFCSRNCLKRFLEKGTSHLS